MNSLIVVTAFCSAMAIVHAQTATTFGSRDISHLLRDNSLVQRQINCVLDRSPCDELGTMLKCKFILQLLNSCLVYITISSPVVSIPISMYTIWICRYRSRQRVSESGRIDALIVNLDTASCSASLPRVRSPRFPLARRLDDCQTCPNNPGFDSRILRTVA